MRWWQLDDRGFELELAKKAGAFLPDAKLAGPRHAFGLGLLVAERFHAPRAALAGDSAHVIHPLGGQGLNLGLKDAAALVDVIDTAGRAGLDIGAEIALEPYTAWRRADVIATAAAMEGVRPHLLRAIARATGRRSCDAGGRLRSRGAQIVRARGRRRSGRPAEPDAGGLTLQVAPCDSYVGAQEIRHERHRGQEEPPLHGRRSQPHSPLRLTAD